MLTKDAKKLLRKGKEKDQLEKLLVAGDLIAETSRELDSMGGALSVLSLSLTTANNWDNPMFHETFKAFRKKYIELIIDMVRGLRDLDLLEKRK